MGFDAWGGGRAEAAYLASCHASAKYKRGQWWVLVDVDDRPLSSLICYVLAPHTIGIGSLATAQHARKQGHASELLRLFIAHCESAERASAFYLFADIDAAFYERFGFVALPATRQLHKDSVCMLRAQKPEAIWSAAEFAPPKYF